MSNLLNWIKGSPLTVAAIVIALAAVVLVGMTHVWGNGFVEQMKQNQSVLREIDSLSRQSVQVPPEKPADPPRTISGITINQPAIDQLQDLYGKIRLEFTRIFKVARDANEAGHVVMQPQLFPEGTNVAAVFNAKTAYLSAMAAMLQPPSADARGPRLNAGPPVPMAQLEEEARAAETQVRQQFGIPANAPLSEDQQKEVFSRQETRVRAVLRDYARNISIYAVTDLASPDFPFEVGDWARSGDQPSIRDLWNGQMSLWIQQDLAGAIAIANRVGDPDYNVYNAPVKQLIKVDVSNGPVGITTNGAIVGSTETAVAKPATVDPMTGAAAVAPQVSIDQRLPDNFTLSPTGRVSNPLYDVWHVTVDLVADSEQLPQLFAAINAVNFMTVLSMQVDNVDEYAALRQGLVFGAGDAVKVRLVIESIWLRDFTTKFMPRDVKADLGIPESTN